MKITNYRVSITDADNGYAAIVSVKTTTKKKAVLQVMYNYLLENECYISDIALDAFSDTYGVIAISEESTITFVAVEEEEITISSKAKRLAAKGIDNADEIIEILEKHWENE